jgi:outer membrane protein assembly factor BamB
VRAPLLALLLLLGILPTPAAAQAPEATIEPAVFEWNDYSRSFAAFTVNVTNMAGQADAFTITEIRVQPSVQAPIGTVYSPTPTLPLASGARGSFTVWVGGFEQPSPPGPAAGNYTVDVKVQSTLDPNRQHTVQATIRRTFPLESGTGVIAGSVRDSKTGELPLSYGPIEVAAHDADNVRVLPHETNHKTLDPSGRFRFDLPAGKYWLRVEGSGYQTAFLGPLTVRPGDESSADVSLSPNIVGRFEAQQPTIAKLPLPSYRLATTIDLASSAVTPGFYTKQPGQAAETVALVGSDGQVRWTRALPPTTTVPFDNPVWTSTDHGVDVSADGARVAVGTAGGTIEIFAADGKPVGAPYRGQSDVNPLVPGPLGAGLLRSSEVRFSHDGTRLAAGSLTGWVYLFDAINGTLVWKTPTKGQVRALRFDPNDDRVYAGSGDNQLYALDATSGTVLWTRALGFWPWEHIGMTNDGGLLLTGGKDGVLRLFDNAGKLEWSKTLPGFILGFDIRSNGQQMLAMTSNGIYSFNRAGQLRWFRGEIQNNGQLHMGTGGSFLGYGKSSSSASEASMRVLYADGTLAWEYRSSQPESIYNVVPADDGSRLIANGRSGNVYFFERWSTPPTGPRVPPSEQGSQPTKADGGSPAPGALALLLVLGWAALRRRGRAPE